MVLKYSKYLFRSSRGIYAAVGGYCLLMLLLAPLWGRSSLTVGLVSFVSSGIAYLLTFWPAYLYYRSLYGQEAPLIHQIPCRKRDLLHAHLLNAMLPYILYMLFSPYGCLMYFFGNKKYFAGVFSLKLSELPPDMLLQPERINQIIREFFERNPGMYALVVIMGLVLAMMGFLFVFAVISHVHRLNGPGNRLISGIVLAVILMFAGMLVLTALITGLTFLMLGRLSEMANTGGLEGLLKQPAMVDYIVRLMSLMTVFAVIFAAACYFYSRYRLEKSLCLT